jgi:phosphoglycerol transferase MdoB-like AlkP superfamily enzyme
MDAVYPAEKNILTTIHVWPIATFIVLLICERVIIGYSDFVYSRLLFDFLLTSFVLLLSLKRKTPITLIQNVLVSAIIMYHWLNICVYTSIHFELTWDGIIANINNYKLIWYFFSSKLAAFTASILLMVFILRNKKIYLPMHRSSSNLICFEIFFVLTLSCAISYAYANEPGANNSIAQGNAINLTTQSFSAYAVNNNVLNKLLVEFPLLAKRTRDSQNHNSSSSINQNERSSKQNIVIVLSESLSAVDSKYANGLFDRLPLIDKIQQDGLVFTNMAANGKISVQGLAALLLGVIANKTGGYTSITAQFPPSVFTAHNVIAYAKKHGYQTIAITSNPPYWENAANWLKKIGFDTVIGPDSIEFANAPHYTWDVPSDEYLYNVALKKAAQQTKPYLIFIETISLHPPYVLPGQKYKVSDEALRNQINYVDHTTFDFYNKLKAQDFFNNGLFVLLGDHRRFEPLEGAETLNGGYAVWHERIVGTIIGKNIKPHSNYHLPINTVDFNRILHMVIAGQQLNEKLVNKANLSNEIGINIPLSITLTDEKHGSYLIRSEKYNPLYVSIYGNVPIGKIPNNSYKQAVGFLMLNDLWIKKSLR